MNKKFGLGMLVLALVFGLMVLGCDDNSGSGGGDIFDDLKSGNPDSTALTAAGINQERFNAIKTACGGDSGYRGWGYIWGWSTDGETGIESPHVIIGFELFWTGKSASDFNAAVTALDLNSGSDYYYDGPEGCAVRKTVGNVEYELIFFKVDDSSSFPGFRVPAGTLWLTVDNYHGY